MLFLQVNEVYAMGDMVVALWGGVGAIFWAVTIVELLYFDFEKQVLVVLCITGFLGALGWYCVGQYYYGNFQVHVTFLMSALSGGFSVIVFLKRIKN